MANTTQGVVPYHGSTETHALHSASPAPGHKKEGFAPSTPLGAPKSHSIQVPRARCPVPPPHPSSQPVPIPSHCFLQGFLLLPLPSPAHYYYDFILMQKRFHKRPFSLPCGAGPAPASLECSPAASCCCCGRSRRGLCRTLHRAPHTAALFPWGCSTSAPDPRPAPAIGPEKGENAQLPHHGTHWSRSQVGSMPSPPLLSA